MQVRETEKENKRSIAVYIHRRERVNIHISRQRNEIRVCILNSLKLSHSLQLNATANYSTEKVLEYLSVLQMAEWPMKTSLSPSNLTNTSTNTASLKYARGH